MIMLGGFAPLADALRGFSDMLCYPEELRKKAATYDFQGTFCSAVIKSFLVSSTVFVGLLLIIIYLYRLYFFLGMHLGLVLRGTNPHALAQIFDLGMYRVSTWGGLMTGALLCFFLIWLVIFGVKRTSLYITTEIRSQFSTYTGIWTGERLPDYLRIFHVAAGVAMRTGGLVLALAFVLPFVTTFVFKVNGAVGLMLGGLIFGFMFGMFFNYCGALWRGAKKLIELQESGIQSADYVGAIFTDSIGDIFKDALAPSFSILVNVIGFATILSGALIFYVL
jgi:Na+/H+-translocating membrane pyrophosphatase